MNENQNSHSQKAVAPEVTLETLLSAKRHQTTGAAPSDGFWDSVFAPSLTRKLMAALSRPKHTGRGLTIFGWSAPFVFGALVAVAIGVAYMFSPERAIARWEAEATSKQYVVDNLNSKNPSKGYKVDGAQYTFTGDSSSGLSSYQFTSGKADNSQF